MELRTEALPIRQMLSDLTIWSLAHLLPFNAVEPRLTEPGQDIEPKKLAIKPRRARLSLVFDVFQPLRGVRGKRGLVWRLPLKQCHAT